LHVQDVIARWQCDTKLSSFVRRNACDFVFAVLAQDHQRVFGVISFAEFLRGSLGKFNIFVRKNSQTPFEKTRAALSDAKQPKSKTRMPQSGIRDA
jgi:hypothetical protein